MLKKSAQVTLFIIVGIVLLISFLLILFFVFPRQPTNTAPQTQGESIKLQNYLQSCLKDSAIRGVYQAGIHGGHIAPRGDQRYNAFPVPEYNLYFLEGSTFPYVLDKSKVSLLSKELIEEKIAGFVSYELAKCINASAFPYFRMQKPAKPVISVSINLDDVNVIADYPVQLAGDGQTIVASEVSAVVPVRFGLVYDIAEMIVNSIKNSADYDISRDCSEFGDNMINVYSVPGKKFKLHAVRIIDAKPLYDTFNHPFEFRMGIKNANLHGVCAG